MADPAPVPQRDDALIIENNLPDEDPNVDDTEDPANKPLHDPSRGRHRRSPRNVERPRAPVVGPCPYTDPDVSPRRLNGRRITAATRKRDRGLVEGA